MMDRPTPPTVKEVASQATIATALGTILLIQVVQLQETAPSRVMEIDRLALVVVHLLYLYGVLPLVTYAGSMCLYRAARWWERRGTLA